MKKKFLFVSVVAGLAATGSAQSVTTVWPPSGSVETFEYADNTALDAVYGTISFQAGYGISTEQNHSAAGTKSLKLGDSDNVQAAFTAYTDTTGTSTTATYYYYDTDSTYTGPNRTCLMFAAYTGGAWASGTLENYLALGTYTTAPGNNTNYIRRIVYGGGTGWAPTTAVRSTGWHKMQISLQNGNAEFGVDDNVVSTGAYTSPAGGWNCFKLGAVAGTDNLDTFIDDLVVEKTIAADVQEWHLY